MSGEEVEIELNNMGDMMMEVLHKGFSMALERDAFDRIAHQQAASLFYCPHHTWKISIWTQQ